VPHVLNELNLKDIQAILEGLSVYYGDKNYDPAFSQRLVEQIKTLLGKETTNVQLQMLHSLFKSFRAIRYHNPEEIFTLLTQKVIQVVKEGTIDENLFAYAVNRLGFMGQVENMR